MTSEARRLIQQLEFVVEIDRLKRVLRRTVISDRSRNENSAEHSWHLAVMAMLLEEHANEPVDITKVIRMLLVHDLVEIDAGDTFCYDEDANLGKLERERAAAERLFGLLPEDQAREFRRLWDEFEERETMESRFATAIDRLQPMLSNLATEGHSWREYGIDRARVVARNQPVSEGSRVLWEHIVEQLDEAVRRGHLEDES